MERDNKTDNKKLDKRIQNLAKPKESKIEKDLVNLVLAYGGAPIKIQGVSNKSMPDRLCLFPGGKVWFVETKRPGKKPDKLQIFTHRKLREIGFKVNVVSNAEQLKEFENDIQAT